VVGNKVVNIGKLSDNMQYNFKFTVIRAADEDVCQLDLPSEFDFMPTSEVEMITSLLMSYFFSAEIFVKANASKLNRTLGSVPNELLGETVTLSICKSKKQGFTFVHEVSESIKGSAGERVIACSIEDLLLIFEKKLADTDTAEV
jgi:hypothetical protein